jgi:hypothetical protein
LSRRKKHRVRGLSRRTKEDEGEG